ncbi:MAG: hypothetical protein AAFU34_19330 [Pseudomonadota bacterium]
MKRIKQPFSWRIGQVMFAELQIEFVGHFTMQRQLSQKETINLRETILCQRCKGIGRYLGGQIDVLPKTEAGGRNHHAGAVTAFSL